MLQVMMILGVYPFSIHTAAYQALKRTWGWRWVKQDRLDRRPAYRFVGPGGESLSLDGVIYPAESIFGLHQVGLMVAEADLGTPLMLIDGNGWLWSRWVIASIAEKRRVFLADGTPRKIEFSMALNRYGEDGDGSGAPSYF